MFPSSNTTTRPSSYLSQPSSSTASHCTNFQHDLLVCTPIKTSIELSSYLCLQEYLDAYGGSALNEWKKWIRNHDMSSARFVGSHEYFIQQLFCVQSTTDSICAWRSYWKQHAQMGALKATKGLLFCSILQYLRLTMVNVYRSYLSLSLRVVWMSTGQWWVSFPVLGLWDLVATGSVLSGSKAFHPHLLLEVVSVKRILI